MTKLDDMERIEAALSRVGAQVIVLLRGGARIFAEVVAPCTALSARIQPWGTTRVLTIALRDIVNVSAAEVETHAQYRAIRDRQRAELEGDGGADA